MPQTLQTPRLVLRPLAPTDTDAIQTLCGDWEVVRWLARVPYPLTRDEVERFLATATGEHAGWQRAIALRDVPERLIGVIGIEPGTAGGHLGYWLGRAYWGYSLMTEAAGAAVDRAFVSTGAEVLVSGAFEGNRASLRIQERLGFRISGERRVACLARGEAVRHIDTRLTRAAWDEARGRVEAGA